MVFLLSGIKDLDFNTGVLSIRELGFEIHIYRNPARHAVDAYNIMHRHITRVKIRIMALSDCPQLAKIYFHWLPYVPPMSKYQIRETSVEDLDFNTGVLSIKIVGSNHS